MYVTRKGRRRHIIGLLQLIASYLTIYELLGVADGIGAFGLNEPLLSSRILESGDRREC
jgi:hypothetical protein